MMTKTTRTYSGCQNNLYIGKNLRVSLNIYENKYNMDWTNLFSMAARKNPNRDFLFVSKVLGKHIPIKPVVLKIIGGILCRLWVEERESCHDKDIDILLKALSLLQSCDMSDTSRPLSDILSADVVEKVNTILASPVALRHKTLFIGFAETATGIAQAVFSSSLNSYYIHTTRESITSIKQSVLFYEEHSHVKNHMIYPLEPAIFEEVQDIVLIDDELTTGKTALNLIRNLPVSKNYGIISILDWRSEASKEVFEHENLRNIKVCSLIKGTIECEKSGELSFDDPTIDYSSSSPASHRDICLNYPKLIEGFIDSTGRFGLSSEMNNSINEDIKKIAEVLKRERIEGNCLCLGTGEFIYIPCLISAELGERVFFHSTTRSPVYSIDEPNYPIRNKVSFIAHDGSGTINYLYNIPRDFYKQVFVFSEKTFDENAKETFNKIFGGFNIKNAVYVSWNPDTYKGK